MLFGDLVSIGIAMGLKWLLMANYGGFQGILSGLTKSTDHPSGVEVQLPGFCGGSWNSDLPGLPKYQI